MTTKNQNNSEIQLLTERIEKLENEIKAIKKKWYKSPAIVISAIALIVTIVFSSLNIVTEIRTNLENEISNKTKEIDNLISQLVQIEKNSYNSQGVEYELILERTLNLVNSVEKDLITPNVYLYLGECFLNDGNFKRAEDFLQKAITYSKEDINVSINSYMWLYSVYSDPQTNLLNNELSDQCLRKSLELCNRFDDQIVFAKLVKSDIFKRASNDEFFSNNNDIGNVYLDSAIHYLQICITNEPNEKYRLEEELNELKFIKTGYNFSMNNLADYNMNVPNLRVYIKEVFIPEFRKFNFCIDDNELNFVVEDLLKFGIETLADYNSIIPVDYISKLTHNVNECIDMYDIVSNPLIIKDYNNFFNLFSNVYDEYGTLSDYQKTLFKEYSLPVQLIIKKYNI